MAAGRIVVPSYFPARDRNGLLVSGARLYVRQNKTSVLAPIYADEALTTPRANPVVANSSGQFPVVWAEAGTEENPVFYSVEVTEADGASIGNPFAFDDWRPSVDAETAQTAIAEAAAEAAQNEADRAETEADRAAVAADKSESALEQIEDIASGSPSAPSILNKADRDGSNLTDPAAWRGNIGAAVDEGEDWASVITGAFPDTASQALFALLDAAGDDIGVEYIGAYDALFRGLVDCGAWERLGVIYLLAAPTQAVALLNLKDPGAMDLTVQGAPPFTAWEGYAGDGSSAHLTGPAYGDIPGFTQNDASLLGWDLSSISANGEPLIGATGAAATGIWPHNASGQLSVYANSSVAIVAVPSPDGMSGWTRTGATTLGLFKNGARVFDAVTTSSGLSPGVLAVHRSNTTYGSRQCAFAAAGAALTDLQQALVYAAVRDFLIEMEALS